MDVRSFQHITPPLRLFHGPDSLGQIGRELERVNSRRTLIFCGSSLAREGSPLDLIYGRRWVTGASVCSMAFARTVQCRRSRQELKSSSGSKRTLWLRLVVVRQSLPRVLQASCWLRKAIPGVSAHHRSSVAPGVIEIKTKGGELLTRRVDKHLGWVENPLSKEDLIEKFRDCASYSVKPLSKKSVDKVIDMVDKLDEVRDVRNLIEIVS